mmetsp:Transcript_125999/g.314859  ORF Transcript_125999/g.314859 Transcript_125999/m.314859 type:complete len:205 (-) Transcript_125999:211-825(-)
MEPANRGALAPRLPPAAPPHARGARALRQPRRRGRLERQVSTLPDVASAAAGAAETLGEHLRGQGGEAQMAARRRVGHRFDAALCAGRAARGGSRRPDLERGGSYAVGADVPGPADGGSRQRLVLQHDVPLPGARPQHLRAWSLEPTQRVDSNSARAAAVASSPLSHRDLARRSAASLAVPVQQWRRLRQGLRAEGCCPRPCRH